MSTNNTKSTTFSVLSTDLCGSLKYGIGEYLFGIIIAKVQIKYKLIIYNPWVINYSHYNDCTDRNVSTKEIDSFTTVVY